MVPEELLSLTALRQDIHAHPELGYEEHRTSEVVQRELTSAGVTFKAGLARGTGVLGYLPATESPATAATVALRADMDALPIHEKTGHSYASQVDGKMHACGHDGHTTILIGVARALANTSVRPNNVLLIFQPAEEGGAGGKAMVDDGVLAGRVLGKAADRIFGLHGSTTLPVGQIGTREGAMMASADGFELLITGKGGHAAMPHYGIDPIVVASHIITALQTIASRGVSPLDSIVVTIGKVQAGTASNIIPDTALLVGTLRTLNDETRDYAQRRISEIASGVATSLGARAELSWSYGYPVTANDPGTVHRLRKTLASTEGVCVQSDPVQPVMGAEDFSFYGLEIPACFYWLGLLDEPNDSYPNLHAPEFDFNDRAIPVGVGAMSALALGTD